MIDIALLGTGGMMPLPRRWLSSLLVRVGGDVILFDCGEGTQIAWRATGWSFRRLSAICISHTHSDHIAGLPGLLHTVANTGRTEPITIVGPAGLAAAVQGLRVIAPELPYQVVVRELVGGEAFPLPGGVRGTCAAGEHALPVLAYRLDLARRRRFLADRARALGIPTSQWRTLQDGQAVVLDGRSIGPDEVVGLPRPGISVGYVTDTRPTVGIAELIAGVTLLVCEGTYGDDAHAGNAVRNQHMTFREAATLARDAGVQQLWLTHFSPGVDDPQAFTGNAQAVFPGAVIGRDGMMTSLVFPNLASRP
ncbi:MAG: ribonuclease Z [Thermomicrobiales bacterium]|nr:ribonuclease Z [Thermomicrobiales bacterium]